MARGGGSLLVVVVVVVCFQERGEIRVSARFLPPGKPSVAVGLARRRDAEDSDTQMGGDLEAQACAVACQVHKGQNLRKIASCFITLVYLMEQEFSLIFL